MNKQLKRSLCALSLALFLLPQLPLSVPAEKAEEETEAPEIVYTNYTVSSVQDLQNLADTCRLDSASKTLRVTLTADLDLKDHENLMIPTFGGIFDGEFGKVDLRFIQICEDFRNLLWLQKRINTFPFFWSHNRKHIGNVVFVIIR